MGSTFRRKAGNISEGMVSEPPSTGVVKGDRRKGWDTKMKDELPKTDKTDYTKKETVLPQIEKVTEKGT